MASIDSLKASDGSGNASVATVQNARSPLATTIQVDTVQGINDNFFGTMGTPHTFTDPVTGETITIISEDTAVDFKGHVDGSNLEIDEIAPGYVDDGSEVGDIVIIRPTTQWGDEVAEVLEVSHNDDGTFKDDSISDSDMFTDPLNPITRASETIFDHVASGLVWTGDSYGSNRNASMTAGVVYINGIRVPVSAVTARTFTASKDTYIDVGLDGVVDYTEVANNAASPALAASHVRIGIIVTGASNIANVGSVNQGQENKVLPIASSIAYTTTDSLGNLICPRDPNRRVLGYRRITSDFGTSSGSYVTVTGLSVPFIAPGNRKVRTTFKTRWASINSAGVGGYIDIYDGSAELDETVQTSPNTNYAVPFAAVSLNTPPAGLNTYTGRTKTDGGTISVKATSTSPAYVLVELA